MFFKSLLRALWILKEEPYQKWHHHFSNACCVPSTNVTFGPHMNGMGVIVFISLMRQLIDDNSEGVFNRHKISQVINGRSRIQNHCVTPNSILFLLLHSASWKGMKHPPGGYSEVEFLLAHIRARLGSLCK